MVVSKKEDVSDIIKPYFNFFKLYHNNILLSIYSYNVDYANIRLYSSFGRLVDKPGVPPFYDGIIRSLLNEDNIGPRGEPWGIQKHLQK